MKRIISLVVAAVLLLTLMPASLVMAASFVDFPTGWSKEAMTAAVDNGLLVGYVGYEGQEIRPQGKLTRAEFAAIMVRAFGAETRADVSAYEDVQKSEWYYDYIAKVVKMGAMQGVSATRMNPNSYITREEVFTAFARILVLSDTDLSVLSKFKDAADVSDWAKPGMSALTKRGYVNGDDLGNVNPKANITREEFAQLMHNAIRTYITEAGTYKDNAQGILVLRCGDVTLQNLSVTSDLVIGDGVMEGEVFIEGVSVEKRLLARGGTITLKNTKLGENVVVNNVNGITPFKNYRDEAVFEGLVENTKATFLEKPVTGGGGAVVVNAFTIYVDDVAKKVVKGSLIDSLTYTNKLGYTFNWKDELGNPIAAGTVLTDGMKVYSNYTLNVYPVKLMDADGVTPFANYKAGYTAPTSFTIENQSTTLLPKNENVEKLGYKLLGWKLLDGTDISALAVTTDLTVAEGITLKAVWEKVPYQVAFKNMNGTPFTDFIAGYTPSVDFDIENPYTFPEMTKVYRAGYEFLGWVKRVDTGGVISYEPYGATLSVEAGMGTTVDVYADFAELATVKFYRGYNTLVQEGAPVSVRVGHTLAATDLPDMTLYTKTGYSETESIASVYAGNEYTHTTEASLWYVDTTGTLVPFTATTLITGDTDVFILAESLAVNVLIRNIAEPLRLAAYYDKNTRVMTSIKDMAKDGKQLLDKAITLGMIPNYDETKEKLIEKLANAGLIDENMNIKVSEIALPISTFVKQQTAESMVRQFVREIVADSTNFNVLYSLLLDLETQLILGGAMPSVNLHDEALVRAYIDGLNPTEKVDFADAIYNAIDQKTENRELLDALLNGDDFEINDGNLAMVIVVSGAISKLSLDDALLYTGNTMIHKLINIVGKARVNSYYVESRNAYCDGLDDAIARVRSTHQTEKYTTNFTWVIDIIEEILVPLYTDAVPRVKAKLQELGVWDDGNKYLKYLVEEDNIITNLLTYNAALDGATFTDAAGATYTLTGYTVKDILAYYDYLYKILLVADDALCYYGDNVTPAEFAAVYSAVFDKAEAVYAKLRTLLEAFAADGSLPPQVDALVSQVQQINDLLSQNQARLQKLVTRYLGSDIDSLIASGNIDSNEKVQKLADWLVGEDNPVITVDKVYELFYNYDDRVQARLQELIDSGELQAAVDKFESTSIGAMFNGNGVYGTLAERLDEIRNSGRVTSAVDSVYDLLCIIAKEGIEPFRVAATESDPSVKDDYQVTVGDVTLRITRKLEF